MFEHDAMHPPNLKPDKILALSQMRFRCWFL